MMTARHGIALFLTLALCTAVISCSKKETPAGDKPEASSQTKLPDAEITRPLPPEGTPEYEALKKQYLEQRFASVQQKKATAALAGQPSAGPAATPTPEQQAVAAEVGQEMAAEAGAGATAPSGGAQTPAAGAPPVQPGVTPGATAGSVRRAEITSDFRCASETDCTFTKFANAPTRKDDCTCQAACTPFVVNKTEKERREAANKRHCDNNDWFGDQCPAPPCSFIEFDNFRCVEGKCVGWALGE